MDARRSTEAASVLTALMASFCDELSNRLSSGVSGNRSAGRYSPRGPRGISKRLPDGRFAGERPTARSPRRSHKRLVLVAHLIPRGAIYIRVNPIAVPRHLFPRIPGSLIH